MFVPILNQPLDDFNSFPSRNTCLFPVDQKRNRHVLRQIASDQDLQHSDQDLQHSDQDLQHSDQDLQFSDQDLQFGGILPVSRTRSLPTFQWLRSAESIDCSFIRPE